MSPTLSTPTSFHSRYRLSLTLLLAILVHALLLFGLNFSVDSPPPHPQTLEVTLARFQSSSAPDQVDYSAQINQQGSGTLEQPDTPKTRTLTPFQAPEVRPVQVPRPTPPPAPQPQPPKEVVRSPQPATSQRPPQAPSRPPSPAAPVFDSQQLSQAIASLEAELSQDVQQYAQRPRISRQNSAATRQDPSAWYRNDWRKKVERIGNLNYPDEARRQKIYGNLRLLVVIRRDGSVAELRILQSSGHAVLDRAALRIVRLAAPFAPFTGELARRFDQLEIIRTWRFEPGNRLYSR